MNTAKHHDCVANALTWLMGRGWIVAKNGIRRDCLRMIHISSRRFKGGYVFSELLIRENANGADLCATRKNRLKRRRVR
jgi:hypothetical protein